MAISMLKIRRPLGRLIFNMGIAIPGKTVFLIETAPRSLLDNKPALVKVMAWCQTGDKPLPEPMLTQITDSYASLRGDELMLIW